MLFANTIKRKKWYSEILTRIKLDVQTYLAESAAYCQSKTFPKKISRRQARTLRANRSEVAIPAQKLILTTKPALVTRMTVVCINGRFTMLNCLVLSSYPVVAQKSEVESP